MAEPQRRPGQTMVPSAGASVRQEIGATQMEVRSETSVQAAEIEAMVKARVALARYSPRDMDVVRQRILADCARPVFADKAIYAKPVGGKSIEGPSVRLAEAMARNMGNMLIDATIAEETLERRRIRVYAMDLETNTTAAADVVIDKTVERREAGDREVIGRRRNSSGKDVFIVLATEDELLNKTNAAVAKMRRNKILELIPSDIAEEAEGKCNETLAAADAKDPAGARKRLCDAFFAIGVAADALKAYIGHGLDTLSPSELQQLRRVHNSIKEGETTWHAVVEARTPKAKSAPPAQAPVVAPAPSGVPPHDPVTGEVLEASKPAQAVEPEKGPELSDDEKALLAEVSDLRARLAAATSAKDARALVPRLRGLPEPERSELQTVYETRMAALGNGNGGGAQ